MNFSAHVIDAVYGRPAEGILVRYYSMSEGVWTEEGRKRTDSGGLVSGDSSDRRALFRLEFDLDAYFSSLGIISYYPVITLTFRAHGQTERQLISLLVTPSAYTIFREK